MFLSITTHTLTLIWNIANSVNWIWFAPAQEAIGDSESNDKKDKEGVRVNDDGGEVPVRGGDVGEEEEGDKDDSEEGEVESSRGGDWVVGGQEVEKKSAKEVAQGEAQKTVGGHKKGFLKSSPIFDPSHWYYQVGQDGEAGDGDGEDDEDDQQLGLDLLHNVHQLSFVLTEQRGSAW